MAEEKKIGIFRFYNYSISDYGEPFGLCEEHEQIELKNPPPFITKGNGYMEKIAESGTLPCDECESEEPKGFDGEEVEGLTYFDTLSE